MHRNRRDRHRRGDSNSDTLSRDISAEPSPAFSGPQHLPSRPASGRRRPVLARPWRVPAIAIRDRIRDHAVTSSSKGGPCSAPSAEACSPRDAPKQARAPHAERARRGTDTSAQERARAREPPRTAGSCNLCRHAAALLPVRRAALVQGAAPASRLSTGRRGRIDLLPMCFLAYLRRCILARG